MSPKELKYHRFYMDLAIRTSQMSHAIRYKVGAIIVEQATKANVISFGWNGRPSNCDNVCEFHKTTKLPVDHETFYYQKMKFDEIVSYPDVIHAEINAIEKVKHYLTDNTKKFSLYVNVLPCLICANEIIKYPITKVIYKEGYVPSVSSKSPTSGYELLQSNNVNVIRLT